MDIPLISRSILFGNPDKAAVKLSPDGAQIAYLAPLDGVLNVWVAPRDQIGAARAITHDTGRGIRFYAWAYSSQHILYIQDKNGDENWRLYSVNVGTKKLLDLTPFEGVQARIQEISQNFPQELLLGLNHRNPQLHDLYRVNLTTGDLAMIQQNDGFSGYLTDEDFNIRAAMRMTPEGGMSILKPSGDTWQPWEDIPAEDLLTTHPAGFDKSGNTLYIMDSRGRNTSALFAQNMETGEKTLLAEDARSDVTGLMVHPTEYTVQAVSFTYERKTWTLLDPALEVDLAYLRGLDRGEVEVSSRTLDDRYWIVYTILDDNPVRYYLYDRSARQAEFLFSNRADLEGQPLVKMNSAVIKTGDGLDMVVYYTLPAGSDSDGDGIPDQALPMVSFPHGGPWGRDFWGFNVYHQWLSNRGYVVLSMNFRSSTGFGKAFANAGDREWGGKIIQDQLDAVQWAVSKGIADPQKVGVRGGSFGGYSTLAGLTFFPESYACGVDLVGPSNLITLLETIPPYWKPQIEMFANRVGDHRTEEGRALLKKHSPLTYVDRIRAPLLIGQGANDPRVKKAEADQIYDAMRAKGLPVTYVLYPDEGHGFARPENNMSFNAITEAFLAKFLGGRYEPVGSDFSGSSLQVLGGAEEVPGLKEEIQSHAG